MTKIAIIGFGFCGTMAFYHLAKKTNFSQKIYIFDDNGFSALGPAFSAISPHYILNVMANKMSAFYDDEDDFCNYLKINHPYIDYKKKFIERIYYGQYLMHLKKIALENADKNGINFEFINQKVVEIKKDKENFIIKTDNNNYYQANKINIATSFIQKELNFNSPRFIKNLWSDQHFHEADFVDNNKISSLAIIGSGLSAVDVITGLKKRNYNNKIYVISRRGNFPKKHIVANHDLQLLNQQDAVNGILYICRKIRNFLKTNPQFTLVDVVESVRHSTVILWHNFDDKNKKLFLKLLPYWNILRHRAPIDSIDIIEKMISQGQIEIIKSEVKNLTNLPNQIQIQTKNNLIKVDYLINCLGFELKARKYKLLDQMINDDLLKEDIFMCSANDKNINLFGGLNIGRDLESTSISDLCKQ